MVNADPRIYEEKTRKFFEQKNIGVTKKKLCKKFIEVPRKHARILADETDAILALFDPRVNTTRCTELALKFGTVTDAGNGAMSPDVKEVVSKLPIFVPII